MGGGWGDEDTVTADIANNSLHSAQSGRDQDVEYSFCHALRALRPGLRRLGDNGRSVGPARDPGSQGTEGLASGWGPYSCGLQGDGVIR